MIAHDGALLTSCTISPLSYPLPQGRGTKASPPLRRCPEPGWSRGNAYALVASRLLAFPVLTGVELNQPCLGTEEVEDIGGQIRADSKFGAADLPASYSRRKSPFSIRLLSPRPPSLGKLGNSPGSAAIVRLHGPHPDPHPREREALPHPNRLPEGERITLHLLAGPIPHGRG